mgnify:CR=1 FL=1
MKLKERLLNYILAYLYKAVTIEDLDDAWNRLSQPKKQQFYHEAKALSKNGFYIWLSEEVQRSCMRRIYLQSTSEQDLIFGKAGLYIEDIRNKKLDNILKVLSQDKNIEK